MSKNKIIAIVVGLVVVLAVVLFFVFRGNKLPVNNSTDNVATVNGVSISRSVYDSQLASALSSLKGQGVDTEKAETLTQIKNQVLEDLISNELVDQGIKSAKIEVTDKEVADQLADIVKQAGGEEKYKEQLKTNNLTEETLKGNILKQLTFQKYLTANIDMTSVSASEKEVQDFYDSYVKSQKESGAKDIPTLKDVTEQIKQQILLNKQQELVSKFINSLKEKAQITRTL